MNTPTPSLPSTPAEAAKRPSPGVFCDGWFAAWRARRNEAHKLNLRANIAALMAEVADRQRITHAPFCYHEETSRMEGKIAALRVRLAHAESSANVEISHDRERK